MSKRPSDWNDLQQLIGRDQVRAQLLEQLMHGGVNPPPPEEPPLPDDVPAARGRIDPELIPPDHEWLRALTKTKDGAFAANIFNTRHVLAHSPEWEGVLGYCQFSYRVIKRNPPPFEGGAVGEWEDADTDRLRIWFCKHFGFTPRTADADGAVMVEAQSHPFHPVRDYLAGLIWDKKPRLRAWLATYMGATPITDDEAEGKRLRQYISLAGTKWMLAAVARVMQPPVKTDCVLILEGLQGAGKSTALAVLGGDWFTDTHFALGDKDGYQQMQGVWLCELAELDAFNKAESTRAKQFFASKEDRYRPAYGRRVQAFARQCVFAGSTNQDGYLKDPTGNRRYWPVLCRKPDMEALARDRDQLWAEAVQLYRLGEKWWVLEHEKYLFEAEQEARYSGDTWEDLIRDWLGEKAWGNDFFTTAEIMKGALKMDAVQMRPPEQTRVGIVMQRLGWARKRKVLGDRRVWGYERPDDWNQGVPPVPPPDEGGTGYTPQE